LEGVEPRPYLLDPDDDWQPRPQTESFDRVRGVIAVHPNNPTGTHVAPEAASRIRELCVSHDTALIVDEVFLDYPLDGSGPRRSFVGESEGLTFVLGGLSKSLGLPQLKLAWVVVDGPEGRVGDALEALAYIADNYLNVSTPVQVALPSLFQGASEIREAIRTRCRENLRQLENRVAESSTVSLVLPEGGWSAVLRFPRVIDEERLVVELLREHGVATHPGFFFDFPREGHLVISLLPAPGLFAEGIDLVLGRIAREVGP
jgi:aspartate/methionine/tyrosine aminotransferase